MLRWTSSSSKHKTSQPKARLSSIYLLSVMFNDLHMPISLFAVLVTMIADDDVTRRNGKNPFCLFHRWWFSGLHLLVGFFASTFGMQKIGHKLSSTLENQNIEIQVLCTWQGNNIRWWRICIGCKKKLVTNCPLHFP